MLRKLKVRQKNSFHIKKTCILKSILNFESLPLLPSGLIERRTLGVHVSMPLFMPQKCCGGIESPSRLFGD